MGKLVTPILYLVFNRLDPVKETFEKIRIAKPNRLYIAGDGPRANRPGETEKVEQVREFILENIDWDCKVFTRFQDSNLGCKIGVSTAIDWFFDNEEMGIILEDDCLPTQSFFFFCQDLLIKYRDDERIGIIGGSNVSPDSSTIHDYYFSIYPPIWGWATWKRTWELYDVSMLGLDEFIRNCNIRSYAQTTLARRYWTKSFLKTYNGEVDTWDYQLTFTLFKNNKINILPKTNLITNIGFTNDATHTKDRSHKNAFLKSNELNFPLIHPELVTINKSKDLEIEKSSFNLFNLIHEFIKSKLNV
ncbi:nucleotide-diphospho-sugar transferase [Candidatus Kapabacteria bacterium]|nr:nucleotide-diphospho-sugar transferase [Candidatus Kapabacteria bacterium]